MYQTILSHCVQARIGRNMLKSRIWCLDSNIKNRMSQSSIREHKGTGFSLFELRSTSIARNGSRFHQRWPTFFKRKLIFLMTERAAKAFIIKLSDVIKPHGYRPCFGKRESSQSRVYLSANRYAIWYCYLCNLLTLFHIYSYIGYSNYSKFSRSEPSQFTMSQRYAGANPQD